MIRGSSKSDNQDRQDEGIGFLAGVQQHDKEI